MKSALHGLISTVIAATIGLALSQAASAQEKLLRVLTWEGYADPQWVEQFEKEAGAKVAVTYVGSVDEIFAKLTASKGADYDVIAVETSSYKRLTEEKLIQPIDVSTLPNAKNLLPAFQTVDALIFDGKTYAVPFAWGSIPLIYDKSAFPTPPDSWNALWDKANSGSILTMDEANNNVVTAALALGIKDPFNLTDEQFAAVKKKLIEQKPLVSTYYAGFDDGVSIFAQGGVSLMMSMGEPQVKMLQGRGVNAALTIPKEGAIGWIDCWTISAGATDYALATKFVDFMLKPEIGKYISEKTGYGNVVDGAANDTIGMNYSDKLVFLQAPEDYAKRQDLWNEVKATVN